MSAARRRRGQPLAALLLVMAGWVGARAMNWELAETPLAARLSARADTVPLARDGAAQLFGTGNSNHLTSASGQAHNAGFLSASPRYDATEVVAAQVKPRVGLSVGVSMSSRFRDAFAEYDWPEYPWIDDEFSLPPGGSAPQLARPGMIAAPPVPLAGSSWRAREGRWSGGAWLLLRRGGAESVASGIARASYGASQAGGVLRYALAPRSGHAPSAYLRASAALNGTSEIEAAGGLSARPIARAPVVVAAELRALRSAGRVLVRPAVLAFTQLPPVTLPLAMRGEAYLQGGYVGGGFSSPFIDGQVRLDRAFARIGKAVLRAGGGVWGGAQKGASRLDVGPGATLSFSPARNVFARASLDWRLQVAGDAAPGSGPALTVAAGF